MFLPFPFVALFSSNTVSFGLAVIICECYLCVRFRTSREVDGAGVINASTEFRSEKADGTFFPIHISLLLGSSQVNFSCD